MYVVCSRFSVLQILTRFILNREAINSPNRPLLARNRPIPPLEKNHFLITMTGKQKNITFLVVKLVNNYKESITSKPLGGVWAQHVPSGFLLVVFLVFY